MPLPRITRAWHAVVVAMAAGAVSLGAQTQTSAQSNAPSARHARPGRLIGVYDALSGDPIDDVTVVNAVNGLSAKTTASGTLSLFFVDTSGGLLRFQKLGYQPLIMLVANSDRDTVGMTVLMDRAAVTLGTVVSRARGARGPADTVKDLEDVGFYERRLTSGAPSSNFITHEKITDLMLLSDVSTLTARPLCETNLYLNGVRISGLSPQRWPRGRTPQNLTKDPVDQLVQPDEVLAIEIYNAGDVPQEYNTTRPPGAPDCGATLIWTRRQ
jgi:hypothetical protein